MEEVTYYFLFKLMLKVLYILIKVLGTMLKSMWRQGNMVERDQKLIKPLVIIFKINSIGN
jgi:hypothetical protein